MPAFVLPCRSYVQAMHLFQDANHKKQESGEPASRGSTRSPRGSSGWRLLNLHVNNGAFGFLAGVFAPHPVMEVLRSIHLLGYETERLPFEASR